MASKKVQETVVINNFETETFQITIVGTSPLIVHAWSEKAKKQMLDDMRNTTKTKRKHGIRIPVADFIDSLYWLSGKPVVDEDSLPEKAEEIDMIYENAFHDAIAAGATFGFPASALKQAAVAAASRNGTGLKSTVLKESFFIKGYGPDQLIQIKGSAPVMREDMVRVGGLTKSPDLRYRGMFEDWSMDLEIEYTKNGMVTREQIVNLISMGGRGGIGEWRPSRNGTYGMFKVKT